MQVSCVIVFPIRLLLQNGLCFFLDRVETLLYIVDHYETNFLDLLFQKVRI